MRYALILDDQVVNVILWDGETPYDVNGFEALELEEGSPLGIGWTRDGDGWAPPPPLDPDPSDDID